MKHTTHLRSGNVVTVEEVGAAITLEVNDGLASLSPDEARSLAASLQTAAQKAAER